MPIDFIAEETEAPKIDFVPDEEEPQPESAAAPRPPVPERPSQQRPPSFEPGELLPQERLPERTPEQKAFMETPLVNLPDVTPWQMKAATALGIPGAQTVENVTRAFIKPVVELAEAATSPEGLAMLPALVAAPMIAGPALAVPMIPEIPHGVEQTIAAAKAGDVPGAIESGVRTGLTTAMTAAGLGAPVVALMPKTRAALAETAAKAPEAPPKISGSEPVSVVISKQPQPNNPDAISQREATPLPVQERTSVSPQVGEEVRQQAAPEGQAQPQQAVTTAEPTKALPAAEQPVSVEAAPNEPATTPILPRVPPEVEPGRIKSYGERYVEELGPEKARERIDHLNRRTEEELQKRPIDQGAITRLQQEAQNIANALDKPEVQAKKAEVVAEPPPLKQPGLTSEEMVGMGGAVPQEFAPTMRTSTGIKNAEVDKARAARGLEPIMKPATQAEQMVWERTMAKIDRDPGWQDTLVEELKQKPRNLSTDEILALDHRYVDLQNEYAKATRDGEQAYKDGRTADVAAAQERTAMWEGKLTELEQIAQSTGAEWGRSGHMRQRLLKEDFTLEAMERKMRAAKGFKPLTEPERANIQKQFAEIEAKNKRLEEIGVEKDRLLAEAQMARTMAEMQAAAAKEGSKIPEQIQRIVTRVGEVLDQRADAARKRLEGKLFSLSPDVLKDLAEIGAANIYHVGMDLAKWSAKMAQDLGERIQPHLKAVWEASLKVYDNTIDMAAGKSETPTKKRAREIIRDNETPEGKTRKLVDRVQKSVTENSDVRFAIQQLAKDFVQRGVRKHQELVESVHDVIKAVMPDDWTINNTADAISGYGTVKLLNKGEVNVELRRMKGELQQLAKLRDMAEGKAPLRTGLERRIPSELEKEYIRAVNEAKKRGNYTVTNPDLQLRTAIDEVKKRLEGQIKEFERRLKEKDFSKRTPREVKLDKEAIALELRRDELKQAYAQELLQKKLAEESTPRKLYRGAGELANVWRVIKTSFDFSAVLNQGKFVVLTRPGIAARAIPNMFRAFRSKEAAFAADKAILNRPNYPLYQKSKLYLSEHGAPLSRMEEIYQSRWAEKIPVVAGSARAYTTFLNRIRADAFDAMVETLGRNGTVTLPEANVLANYINVATGRGGIGIGERVGNGLNKWLFSPRFVASRFQMVLGQPLYHGILTQKGGFLKETVKARKLVAIEYAKLLGAYSVFYGLAHAAGFKIGLDPKSTDFGKIIIGDTRIDPLAGVSQAWVLMHRTVTGKKTTLKGRVQPLVGKVPFGQDDLTDVWLQFGRSKLAPVPAAIVDFRTGENVIGEPLPKDALSLIGQYVGPISLQDVSANMRTMGVPLGIAATIANIFGERIKTYENRKER